MGGLCCGSVPFVCPVEDLKNSTNVKKKKKKKKPQKKKKKTKKASNTFLNTYNLISGYLAKISNKRGTRKDFSTV